MSRRRDLLYHVAKVCYQEENQFYTDSHPHLKNSPEGPVSTESFSRRGNLLYHVAKGYYQEKNQFCTGSRRPSGTAQKDPFQQTDALPPVLSTPASAGSWTQSMCVYNHCLFARAGVKSIQPWRATQQTQRLHTCKCIRCIVSPESTFGRSAATVTSTGNENAAVCSSLEGPQHPDLASNLSSHPPPLL